jgi:hypothetical protein
MKIEPMEALLLTTVGWLAAHILFRSFDGCWYHVVGPVVGRGGGRAMHSPPESPPPPELLEKMMSVPGDDGDPRLLLFARRSEAVYTFQREKHRGPSLLQWSVRFDQERGTYEVQARAGLFFVLFLLSLAVFWVVANGFDDTGGVIFAAIGLLALFVLAIADLRICKRVVDLIADTWR